MKSDPLSLRFIALALTLAALVWVVTDRLIFTTIYGDALPPLSLPYLENFASAIPPAKEAHPNAAVAETQASSALGNADSIVPITIDLLSVLPTITQLLSTTPANRLPTLVPLLAETLLPQNFAQAIDQSAWTPLPCW